MMTLSTKNEKINQEYRAYVLWSILVNCARKKETITYKEVSEKMGIHHRVLRWPLGLIQDHCSQEKLPHLTILVVNAQKRVPGDGFIDSNIDDKETALEKVYQEQWNFENPFSYAKNEKDTQDSISNRILINADNDLELEKVWGLVPNRGQVQIIFRGALIKAYDGKCAFCGFSFDILEAAHIIPWNLANKAERLSPSNGLLLCPTHHKLYDNGFLWVNENYQIISYDPNKKAIPYSESDIFITYKLNNAKIKFPENKNYYPNKEYLKRGNHIRKVKQI